MSRRIVLGGVVGVIAMLVAAVGALSSWGAPAPKRVAVAMTEFKFTGVPKTVSKGTVVTFALTNKGKLEHDFKIAGKKSPLIDAGKRGTLKVTFGKAGHYQYICTVPTHAQAGMKGFLTVK